MEVEAGAAAAEAASAVQWAKGPVGSSRRRVQGAVDAGEGVSVEGAAVAVAVAVVVVVVLEEVEAGMGREGENRALFSAEKLWRGMPHALFCAKRDGGGSRQVKSASGMPHTQDKAVASKAQRKGSETTAAAGWLADERAAEAEGRGGASRVR